MQGDILEDDEDVVTDLIGYFILLKVALQNDYNDKNASHCNVPVRRNGVDSQESEHHQPINPH